MAKKHKYHDSRIEIDTALPVDRLLDLSKQTAETQPGVHLADEHTDGFSAAVKNAFGITNLTFSVHATGNGVRTSASTRLDDYMTSQTTVYLIPVGPKLIGGYGEYRRFMGALEQVVRAADPTARCTIIEREDIAS
ncbi:MAG: hypothetical protein GX440_12675 [Propionibacterium sp.]|jgi:hypothetical protein|nr:hypothetical protein [Propionibacterium sp.]